MADRKKLKQRHSWPESVPILTADDMVWNFTTQDGRRDLLEWLLATFDSDATVLENPAYVQARKVLLSVISERRNKTIKSMWLFAEKASKAKHPSFAWQAACWNEMLIRLGYDVPKRMAVDPGMG